MNIAAPSAQAQIAVYQQALAAAGVEASTVGMVEAHGTGTPLEIRSNTRAWPRCTEPRVRAR